MAYDFPGNVRELENIIERAYALGADSQIRLDDLPLLQKSGTSDESPRTLRAVEHETIRETLTRFDGDKARAADALGLSLRTFYRRLKEIGIS